MPKRGTHVNTRFSVAHRQRKTSAEHACGVRLGMLIRYVRKSLFYSLREQENKKNTENTGKQELRDGPLVSQKALFNLISAL